MAIARARIEGLCEGSRSKANFILNDSLIPIFDEMKTHFFQVRYATQSPDTFFHTILRKIAFFIRKSQNTCISKINYIVLYYRYCPNLLSVCFPMSEVDKKLKLRLYDAILALSKNKRAFFGYFRLFSAFKCEVFEITPSSYHSF